MAIYSFQDQHVSQEILGNKGKYLSKMYQTNLPVPAGIIISSNTDINELNTLKFQSELETALDHLEQITNQKLANRKLNISNCNVSNHNPLLLSVRSGAVVSMPGMMNTILNIGLNQSVYEQFKQKHGIKFANAIYNKFLLDYASLILECPPELLNKFLIPNNPDPLELLDFLTKHNLQVPESITEQINAAITMVAKSWNSKQAKDYRQLYRINQEWGTAIIIQKMVFGNLDKNSGTGVLFSYNPCTGKAKIFGEYLSQSQGDALVSGKSNPKPLKILPIFESVVKKIEDIVKDIVEIEFTIEAGKLWILQCRASKCPPRILAKLVVDLVKIKKINNIQALDRITLQEFKDSLVTSSSKKIPGQVLARGIGLSGNYCYGHACFNLEQCQNISQPILITQTLKPQDFSKIKQYTQGVITQLGGASSHMAVVLRTMDKVHISQVSGLEFVDLQSIKINNHFIKLGSKLIINGQTGEVICPSLPNYNSNDSSSNNYCIQKYMNLCSPKILANYSINNIQLSDNIAQIKLASWAQNINKIKTYANADLLSELELAIKLGAAGIGLYRTEHMCLQESYLPILQNLVIKLINQQKSTLELEQFKELHIKELVQVLNIVKNKPINIRLLDPPLHEFLPEIKTETNPMLGLRGCRLGVVFPELYKSQIEAIFKSIQLIKHKVDVGIMIPLITGAEEVIYFKNMVSSLQPKGVKIRFGVMLETPRACLDIKNFANEIDFASFGTNDLTQTTWGLSRDDNYFLAKYLEKQIFDYNPFYILDEKGVCQLMCYAINNGLQTNPSLEFSICGEQVSEIQSLKQLVSLDIKGISCAVNLLLVTQFSIYKLTNKFDN